MILNLFNKFNKLEEQPYVIGIKITNSTDISNQVSLPITRLTIDNDPYNLVTINNTGPERFNTLSPWKDMIEWNITANGPEFSQRDANFSRQNNTFVYIPKFYYYRNVVPTGIYFYISNIQFNSNFQQHPGSDRYVSKYMLNANNNSVSGTYANYHAYYETESYSNIVSTFCENVTPASNATNTGIYVPFDVHTLYAIILLYITEYCRWNYMLTLDNENLDPEVTNYPVGLTGFINTGTTDALVAKTGWAFNTNLYGRNYYSFKYREIEDLLYSSFTPSAILISGIRVGASLIIINTNPQYYTSNVLDAYSISFSHTAFDNLSGTEIGGYAHSLQMWQNNASWFFFPGEIGEVKASYTQSNGKITSVAPISKPEFDVINNVFNNFRGTSNANTPTKLFLGSAGIANGSPTSYPSLLSFGMGFRGATYYTNNGTMTQNPSYLYKRSVFIPNSSLS